MSMEVPQMGLKSDHVKPGATSFVQSFLWGVLELTVCMGRQQILADFLWWNF